VTPRRGVRARTDADVACSLAGLAATEEDDLLVRADALQRVAARVNRWEHGRMNGYSEDLRRRIVSAVERGMSKTQAACTFGLSLSSVKRYVNKADRGESLAPKKSPGATPKLDEKANKLLEDDLKGRPFANLKDRCDYIETVTGLSVSRSTICRVIARIGSTHKKGDARLPSATISTGQLGG
jgi:transposase